MHPELPSGASQSPELEPSACPILGSLAGAGEGSGRELDATTGICPSQRAGVRCGCAMGCVAVLCLVDPVGQCWGSGQTPNPGVWPHPRLGCLGHLGCCADSLPVRFARPRQLRWPRNHSNGGGEQGDGGTQHRQPPACSPCPSHQLGANSSPCPGGHRLGSQEVLGCHQEG